MFRFEICPETVAVGGSNGRLATCFMLVIASGRSSVLLELVFVWRGERS